MKSNWFEFIGMVILSCIIISCGSGDNQKASTSKSTVENPVHQEQPNTLDQKIPKPQLPDARPTNLNVPTPSRKLSYDELRAELTENYDKYVAVMNARKNLNIEANEAIQADFRMIISSPDAETFVANTPHVSMSIKDDFFDGTILILDALRKDM